MLEWFDHDDTDLAAPSRKRADRDMNSGSIDHFIIHSGETAKDRLVFTLTTELVPHPGTYKLIIRRHEDVNDVVIGSNPVFVEVK